MYPVIRNDAQVFRLQRVNEVVNELWTAIEKSEATAGKYKKAVISFRNTSIVAGLLGAVSGASATASSMTGVGILAGIPLAAIVALSRKLAKHQLTTALGRSKLDRISKSVSKALQDNTISDDEYRMVLEAIERFREMRTAFRAKGRAPAPVGEDSLRRKITKEVREEMRKKLSLELGDGALTTKEFRRLHHRCTPVLTPST